MGSKLRILDFAWAAGLFDGEGNIRFDPRPGRKNGWCQMQMAQTDRRVLDRFRGVLGIGKVYGPYPQRHEKSKPYFQYSAQGFESVQAAAAMLWRFLSPVKRNQVRATLEAARVYQA